MTNRIRQYPRVEQAEDRAFSPSPANRLLYNLSAIRELYNTSSDGHSANNINDLGHDQLVTFLHHSICMSDFVRWSTLLVLKWAGDSDERISSALQAFQRAEERLCLETTKWQKRVEEDHNMGDSEAKRFSTLFSLLKDSFAILVKHHAAVTNFHHSLGFQEIEMLAEETDMMFEPYHDYVSEAWTWCEHEGHEKRVEKMLQMLLAVLNGSEETASCFRVQYALLLFLPLMPQLVDTAYDLVQGSFGLRHWRSGEWKTLLLGLGGS